MFCPNCGADEQHTDAYCKRCGEWLPEASGIVRRALWGESITPERRLKAILVRQGLSAVLAFASTIILLTCVSSAGGSSTLVKVIAALCGLIGAMQADGFFVALRLRQSLKRNRDRADRAAQSSTAHVAAEETTRQLDPLPLKRKSVE